MVSLSQGRIRLENLVLDLTTLNVRPKATEQDLESYYEDYLNHVEEIGDCFEDRNAFDRSLRDASDEKRPKFIPRITKQPFMAGLRTTFMPWNFAEPSKSRLNDKYFLTAHCIMAISRKIMEGDVEEPLDGMLREDIIKKFEQHPGYECIIEIPNDRTPHETKFLTFHESLHYLIGRYQSETGRKFMDDFDKKEFSPTERYHAEHVINEHTVVILTDKLLGHDPGAQLESRFPLYSQSNNKFRGVGFLGMAVSGVSTGLILGTSITNPYVLPLAFFPERIREYAVEKYKQSKKDEILKPREYPKFKI